MNLTPTEHQESVKLAQYLSWLEKDKQNAVKFSKLTQETFTRSIKQKSKNKQEGLRQGVPDYLITINEHCIFIELKRKKGGRLSEHQKEWIEAINKTGAVATVCYGSDEAIDFLNIVLKGEVEIDKAKKPHTS